MTDCHARRAASFIILLHPAIASEVLIRRTGLDFGLFDHVMVMCVTGTTIYLLGGMFEEVPKSVNANAERQS